MKYQSIDSLYLETIFTGYNKKLLVSERRQRKMQRKVLDACGWIGAAVPVPLRRIPDPKAKIDVPETQSSPEDAITCPKLQSEMSSRNIKETNQNIYKVSKHEYTLDLLFDTGYESSRYVKERNVRCCNCRLTPSSPILIVYFVLLVPRLVLSF